jgi:hypothetical protein
LNCVLVPVLDCRAYLLATGVDQFSYDEHAYLLYGMTNV